MKKMEILVEEKTENQVKKRKFVKVKKRKKRKKSRNYHPWAKGKRQRTREKVGKRKR